MFCNNYCMWLSFLRSLTTIRLYLSTVINTKTNREITDGGRIPTGVVLSFVWICMLGDAGRGDSRVSTRTVISRCARTRRMSGAQSKWLKIQMPSGIVVGEAALEHANESESQACLQET